MALPPPPRQVPSHHAADRAHAPRTRISRDVMFAFGFAVTLPEKRQPTQRVSRPFHAAFTRRNIARMRMRHRRIIASHFFQPGTQRGHVNDLSRALRLPTGGGSYTRTMPLHVDEKAHQQHHRKKPQYDFVVGHILGWYK